MSLEGKALSFGYQRTQARMLEGLNIQLHAGERLGLTAPSGRGKTTLCKLLAGYEQPDEGVVLLDGKPLSAYSGYCPVQMVWQHPETVVDPLMRLGDTLHESWSVEQRILDGLQIQPGWLTRYPAELSGGELQRMCIARALGPKTQFLLCDEISTMLDFITQAQIWGFLLQEAERRNLGLLVVSHTPPLLERLCTRIETLP